jgi:hypothetical protein
VDEEEDCGKWGMEDRVRMESGKWEGESQD